MILAYPPDKLVEVRCNGSCMAVNLAGGQMVTRRINDITIIGAGPAGALLAFELAGAGLDVLLVEKKRLPRYKACGGGLTPRAFKLLPFNIHPVIEDATTTARLLVNGHIAFQRTYPQPVVHMVMRDRLDAFMVERAIRRGARLAQGLRFIGATGAPGNLEIKTTEGTLRTRCLVGADGVHSRTARHLGLNIRYRTMTALEAEIEPDARQQQAFRHRFDFDFGVIDQGYGWVFPKRHHLSAGILTRKPKAGTIRRDIQRYLAGKGLARARVQTMKLHPIPYAPCATNRYANARGLVVGDASGMVDPITGEGIYYALRTARLAAVAIGESFNRGAAWTSYDGALRAFVGREIRYAGWLAAVLYRLPWLSYPFLTRYGDRIAAKLMEVFQGQIGYGALFRYVVGWRGLKHLLATPAKAA